MRKIFNFKEYRDLMQARIDEATEKGYKGKLAAAAGCKSSYLSQVMSGLVHLTPEHAYGIASFWGLNALETDFFLLLVQHERAGTAVLRRYYADKLRLLRQDASDVAKTVQKDSQNLNDPALTVTYFAHWHFSAIHILLGIPGFQTEEAIEKRLRLSGKTVREALELLLNLSLAEKRDGKWQLLKNDIHLPKDSPLAGLAHSHWRYQAIAAQQREAALYLQFSAINSVALEDIARLREVLYDAIASYRKIAQPSAEEELVCMNLDFFKV